MKRIGSVLLSVVLLLVSAVPAGAYQWSGESFLGDYFQSQIMPAAWTSSVGEISFKSFSGFTFDSASFSPESFSPYILSSSVGFVSSSVSIPASDYPVVSTGTAVMTFTFSRPVSSFSLSGSGFAAYTLTSTISSGGSRSDRVFPTFDILVDGHVVKSYPSSNSDQSYNFSFSSSSISSFDIRFNPAGDVTGRISGVVSLGMGFLLSNFKVDAVFLEPDPPDPPAPESYPVKITPSTTSLTGGGTVNFTVDGPPGTTVTASPSVPLSGSGSSWSATLPDETASYTFTASFPGSSEYLASSASCTVHVTKKAVDPDPPSPPDPPDPPGPGPGDDSEYDFTVVEGEELAQGINLGSGTVTGGASVFWEFDSYTIGASPYQVTVPGGSAAAMAPSQFPSISLSRSGSSVTAFIPSTSYSFQWNGDKRVHDFLNLLTGPSGFSGPGTAAKDYIDLDIPFSGASEDVYNFELDGALPVDVTYHAGSNSVSRTGGSWSLLVNGALVTSGTSDMFGKIQFNNFVYHSSEPISSLTLRLVPTAAGLSFPTNTGSITFSWSLTLGFQELSMVYLEGEDEAIDMVKFYGQINNAQGSIQEYETIENQWVNNMSSNWNALNMDSFSMDSGLISGFALLTGIFNDVWNAFGVFNAVWVVPLMLGIALLVIGRISRSRGAGKEG